ncbi:PREDICTED: fanconi-associated nuclease 1-like isoform X2 [Amphimedon queenslandica]|uniref:Fanconi-associated nuclease n=1 Tax=Amphimedon queenslandica TaxID=400682 RepID=A0AAN0IY39_AMPQE|nr:PREDICTED: fanconi-associated nuclease 1-like isoform X2 [Amphimedon queenslandica]|eukprot:XP_019849356.1 PREDICTED: fanconi-associated nuclease 1-like isoform X2 [Amphimedon queenslandica]
MFFTRERYSLKRERHSSSSSSSSCSLSTSNTEGEGDDGVCESFSRDPHYYLTNFMASVSHVTSSVDGHYITSNEDKSAVLTSFKEANVHSQQLLVRLYLRKHRWLRVDKLSYPEISNDLNPFLKELVKKKLLDDDSSLNDPNEILCLLKVDQLKLLKEQLHLPSSFNNLPKNQFISSVLDYCAKQKPLLPHLSPLLALKKKAKLLLGSCVCVSEACFNVFSQISLLFSLITSGDIHDDETLPQSLVYHMLQVSTGQIVYPKYDINVVEPLFSSCEDFEKFYSVHVLQQKLSSLVTLKHLTPPMLRDIMEETCVILLDELKSHSCTNTRSIASEKSTALMERGSHDELLTYNEESRMNGLEDLLCYSDRKEKRHSSAKRRKTHTRKGGSTFDDPIDLTAGSDDEGDHILNSIIKCSCVCYPRAWRLRYNPGSLCIYVLTLCVESWEKLRDYIEANRLLVLLLSQGVFGYYKRGHWWERLALNLDSHLKEKSKSFQCIMMAFKDSSVSESVKYALYQRALRLTGSNASLLPSLPSFSISECKEVLLTGICQPNTPLFIIQDHTPCSSSSVCTVEGFAIHHYTGTGCWPRALHLEGAIFTSLFLLLFWDIIYTNEVPDVFRGHYQGGLLYVT